MAAGRNLYRYGFFITIAIYCLLVGRFGFENWDSGFLSGFSWRIINGDRVYTDFIYIRPPVSAYFHALFMELLPEQGQFFFFRIIGYLLFALQVYFTVSGFDHLFDFSSANVDKWGVMIVAFVLSIHNFFGNPWFTADGILFASAAFYLIARFRQSGLVVLFFAALFCMLSALTKQSFYFVPIFFLAWILIDLGVKKSLWFLFFLALITMVFISIILTVSSIENMMGQISGQTSIMDLYDVGFATYIHCYHNKYIFCIVLLLPLIFGTADSGIKKLSVLLYLRWLSITIFCSCFIALFLIPYIEIPVIFFNATLVAFVYKTAFEWDKIRKYFPVLVVLGIAWCTSLSLGYRHPVLYTTGILVSYLILMQDEFRILKATQYLQWLSIPVCLFVFSLNAKPYREHYITDLSYSLEGVSPKLKYILSSKETVAKYTDLKKLVQQYGPDYITVPSIPMSHYLFGQHNPFPTEWTSNFEINNKTEELLELASTIKMYIFVEKSFIEGEPFIATDGDRNGLSLFTMFIYKNCKPVAETDHFIIYDSAEIGKHL